MKRRGISLMELMIVLSAASTIITTSALVLHKMMRAQEQTRYFFENERAVERLARQFRRDVHDAEGYSLRELQPINLRATTETRDDAEPFLTLQLARAEGTDANTSIEYCRTLTGVLRTITRDGEPFGQEEYAVASIAQLDLREEASPRRLVLTITADPADFIPKLGERAPTIRETPVNMQVVAVVGRDAQFVAIPRVAASQEEGP